MNTFRMEGFENRGAEAEEQIRPEEIEIAVRALHEPIDTDTELAAIVKVLGSAAPGSAERHALWVRRAALLQYGKSRELPVHRQITSVESAQDIPTLSPELERKYPIFGERVPTKPKLRIIPDRRVNSDGGTYAGPGATPRGGAPEDFGRQVM